MQDFNAGMRIACVGEVMFEVAKQAGASEARVGFAGDTFNTAVYLRRLLPQADFEVSYFTRLGRDAMSAELLLFMRDEGLHSQAITLDQHANIGAYASVTDAAGERVFSYWRSQSAARKMFQCEGGNNFGCLEGFDLIYLSAISLAILPAQTRDALFVWLADFRANGGRVAFDSNYRPALWDSLAESQQAIHAAWSLCDIAMPSVDDEMALFQDASRDACLTRLGAYRIPVGVLKQGDDGPSAIPPSVCDSALAFAPATRVVDTTAAGDSFNAGFLAAHVQGASLEMAMHKGHELASLVVSHRGAVIDAKEMKHL